MKKSGKFALAAAALLIAASLPAAAATVRTSCWYTAARTACTVTAKFCRQDLDGDGICDRLAGGLCIHDADGDGICDYAGIGIWGGNRNAGGGHHGRGHGCRG